MKTITLIFLITFGLTNLAHSQITFKGCDVSYPSSTFTLSASGTVTDTGIIRNTYISNTLVGRTIRIIWDIASSKWKIAGSFDNGSTYTDQIYNNTSASYPNPPSLTLGTWIDTGACGISSINILSGDVQNTLTTAPEITTTTATTITKNSATLAGNVTLSSTSVTERGVVYSTTDTTPEIGETGVVKDTNGTGTGVFLETITGLQSDTTYYYRAYAINSVVTGYGVVKSFTTLGVKITAIERENPSLEDLYANTAIYKVTFSKPVKEVDITDFTTNSSGATISNVNQISTTVYEVTVNNITANGDIFLQIKGVDSVTGSNNITTLAVASTLSTTVNQTASNDYLNQVKIGQTYTAGINGVLKKVTFYLEAGQHTFVGSAELKIYAGDETNGGTEIHSEVISITNSTAAAGQEFTLTSQIDVTQGSIYSVVLASFGGAGNYALSSNTTNVYADGHVIFTGMNNSTHLNFDLKIKIEEETIERIGDQTLGTTAPTTNEKYIKLTSPILPIIVTTDATSISETQATLGGIINYSGTTAITERGIVYATADSYPKIGEAGVTKVISAQNTNTFSDTVSGLSTASTYFYRAYATNSNGTSYGAVNKFSLNNSLNFSNDSVDVPNYSYTNGFSFDALLYPETSGASPTFLSRYSSNNKVFSFIIKFNSRVECTITNNGTDDIYFTTTNPLTLNTWQHIAFTYNNADGVMKFYINGIDAGSGGVTGSPSGALFSTATPIQIGSRDNALYYNGSIDELRIWNKTLTESTINSIKNKIVPANADGLLAYYQFNQGIAEGNNTAITQLFNKKTNALEGILNNFPKTGTYSNFIAGASGDFSNNNVAKNSFMTTGNWSDPSKWSFGKVPTQIETAMIDENQIVTIDVNDLEVDDLELAANATLNIPADKEIVVNNSFVSNGNLLLNSDETDSGVLFLNGTSTGTVTYKRGGLLSNKWSIVTPPVAGQKIKAFADAAANDIRKKTDVTPNKYAIAYYDDNQTSGNKWVYYFADMGANIEFEAGKSYAISRATDGEVSFTGTLTTASTTKTLTTNQWVAIGNPFTTYFPANKNGSSSFLNDNLSALDDTYQSLYVWDNAQNKYVVVSEVDASTRTFTPGQGFFVKLKNDQTDITFNEAKRATKPATGNNNFGKTKNTIPLINVLLSDGDYTVNTAIKYFENATSGFDKGYDIGNFNNEGLDIFTRLVENGNETNFTIQSLPNSEFETMRIPVGIIAEKEKEIIITTEVLNLPSDLKVYLEDRENNIYTRLDHVNSEYKFRTTNALDGIGRFYIHTTSSVLKIDDGSELTGINMYVTNNTLNISGLEEGLVSIKMYSVLGKEILHKKIKGSNKNELQIPKVSSGIYIIKLETELGKLTKKIVIK